MSINFLSSSDSVTALVYQDQSYTYAQLQEAIALRQYWLSEIGVTRIGLLADNQPEWLLMDLACSNLDVTLVPIPSFFSAQQRQHLLEQSAIELLLTDRIGSESLGELIHCPFSSLNALSLLPTATPQIPDGTGKITFTSGSTGTPKGVCLSHASQWIVARSLVDTIQLEHPRHLCLLPLPTLLENIAGVYAPLLAEGTVILASEEERGFSGSRLVDPQRLLALISQSQPNSLILVPELLMVLVESAKRGWVPPKSLKFIAVGGAHVSPRLLQQAQALELPVFQGYGLSECVSVTALNTPAHNNLGTVGHPLPHNQLSVEGDQVMVRGNLFLGYLNQPESFYPTRVETGDLGNFDGEYLCLHGRKKNQLINSFGRNLSPEWVEAELLATGLFRHAFVFGEGRPYCGALLVPINDSVPESMIDANLQRVNQQLPDYAQILIWQRIESLEQHPTLLTANGKLKRATMNQHFAELIDACYTQAYQQSPTSME